MQQSELASVQLEWKMSEEEEEGREGESVEDEYEEEVGEEEDLKQQQNVPKGEEDQIYLMKLATPADHVINLGLTDFIRREINPIFT